MCKYNLYTLTWTYRAVIHVEHTPTLTPASEQAPYMIPNAVCVVTYQSYVHACINTSIISASVVLDVRIHISTR